jgi:hypothetical protein
MWGVRPYSIRPFAHSTCLFMHGWGCRALGPVHPNVIVNTEIQELLVGELGAIVGDDGVGDPKLENNVRDETHHLLGADFGQGPCLDPHSEFIDHN